ncbi:MAG: chitobiase/beta-hexosaminidase C-terminal domain-containing protein [Prevotella sp.]|nr:chitobiase/beta-hexosaminidase C-terminal domain-containing protein [Prevotella sp.]
MKKLLYFFSMVALLATWGSTNSASAQGWPQNYGGVMLQGFYWDSFDDTQWALLERQADDLAGSFSLIWIPQSAKAANSTSMGYDPLYWFSNYNSSFGTKEQLVSMIKTFKGKGLGTIADIVINHRSNVSNWVDFPRETYNGVTYELKSTDIVADDDEGATKKWADSNGYSLSSNTEGISEVYGGKCEGWNGMRDLDHASENVQTNVKAYLSMLLSDEFGYSGFRYDVAKGFPAKYFGIYNNASNPTYSVGEFWDGNATNCKKWVEATKYDGKIQSAVFDFPFRYTVRDAANNNDWRKLANTSVMADASYRQYAVTFIENHDTEKRSNAEQDPIRKDTLAANAFLLAMPGTPCVFLKHWQAYKQDIKAMIEARKVAGITNTSSYSNMRSAKEYFANLIKTNDENRLIVVVGSNTDGYQPNSQWQEILSGYHYKYYLTKKAEVAWTDKMSGTYKEAFNVRLIAVSENDNAQLVYTLDGSEPTAASTKVDSGTSLSFSEEGDYILKVGLLVNGSVTSVISRSYTLKEDHPEQFVIPAFCTMGENEVCAFFEAPVNWTSTIACWAWTNTPSDNFTFSQRQNWPGVDCVKIGTADNGNDVWKWSWDGTKEKNSSATQPAFIIFSSAGSPQTADFPFQNGGYYDKDGLKGVVTTGIEDIIINRNSSTLIYTIQGVRLPNGVSLKNLPNGVYIVNGKKVVN